MTDPKPTETVVPAITTPAQVKIKTKRAPTEYNNFCAETLKTLSSFPPKERLTECGRLWKLHQAGKPKTDTTTTSSTTETVSASRASTASSVQSDKKDAVSSSEPKTKKAPAEKKSPTEKSDPVKKQAMPKKEQSVSAH